MAGVGASPREGLVAAQRTVDRGGQTHEQRYWVKPAEIRDMVWKTLGFPRTAAKLHPVLSYRADMISERHEAEAEVAVLTRGAIRVNAGQVTPGGF